MIQYACSVETISLPQSLPAAVLAEFGRAFHDPYEAPICVGANIVLVALGWWLLPASITTWLFGYHGAHALPLTMLSWMIADVPATNVIGGDARRMSVALSDRSTLLTLLVAKAIVLWLLTAPLPTLWFPPSAWCVSFRFTNGASRATATGCLATQQCSSGQ